MKDLVIVFSSLWLIFHAASSTILNLIHNAIHVSDAFQGTDQTNDDLNPLQIIETQGYPAEAHVVTTEDGYILTMHRVPGKPGSPPVFIQHGLLASSADWLYVNKTESLVFMLADQGYDVWLGNFRGNTYSRAHVNLSTDDKRYWDFSWHESGIYDLPAMLTYIVNMKGSPVRAYIGYSMGTTSFYVLSSERPQIKSLVQSAYHLAPIAYLKHTKSPVLQLLAHLTTPVEGLTDIFGDYELLPNDIFIKILSKYLCNLNTLEEKVCANVLSLLYGPDNSQYNYELFPTFTNHFPAGGSIKQVLHYTQLIRSGYFRQYDYGENRNLEIYNSIEPPEYNISMVTTPLAMFWGEGDWLSNREDVTKLVSELPNKPIFYTVPYDEFNHLDFILAKDVRQLLYNEIVDILTQNKLGIEIKT